jgi:hypothetical protein
MVKLGVHVPFASLAYMLAVNDLNHLSRSCLYFPVSRSVLFHAFHPFPVTSSPFLFLLEPSLWLNIHHDVYRSYRFHPSSLHSPQPTPRFKSRTNNLPRSSGGTRNLRQSSQILPSHDLPFPQLATLVLCPSRFQPAAWLTFSQRSCEPHTRLHHNRPDCCSLRFTHARRGVEVGAVGWSVGCC